jgi:hypothetical protein
MWHVRYLNHEQEKRPGPRSVVVTGFAVRPPPFILRTTPEERPVVRAEEDR